MASRTENIGLRLSKEERAFVAQAAKDRGYLSASALMRAAIRNELSGRESEIGEADRRIAASLDRLSGDILTVSRGQQALFAVIDALVKTFLTCVPEPPREAMPQSVARARDRYVRFVASAGQGMVGESERSKCGNWSTVPSNDDERRSRIGKETTVPAISTDGSCRED